MNRVETFEFVGILTLPRYPFVPIEIFKRETLEFLEMISELE